MKFRICKSAATIKCAKVRLRCQDQHPSIKYIKLNNTKILQILGKGLWNLKHIYKNGRESWEVTIPICHAVEEEPGGVVPAVLDKGHVVAGLDAQHCKQLHLLRGDAAVPPVPVWQILGKWQWVEFMTLSLGMKMNLQLKWYFRKEKTPRKIICFSGRQS